MAHDGPGGLHVPMLALSIPRCAGKPAGPSGYQIADECVFCHRRLAPRPMGVVEVMEAPVETPCPMRMEMA